MDAALQPPQPATPTLKRGRNEGMVCLRTMAAPADAHPLGRRLTRLHQHLLDVDDGEVATYIPALAHADPAAFGLSMVTVEGRRYSAGDVAEPFTIQSVSKPFVYALALADAGLPTVLERVGTEPTGDAFNAVTLESGTGRPMNPMVNAGAIEVACLVAGDTVEQKQARVVAGLSAFAGRDLEVDEAVLASEAETGDRNRALAYLMRGAGSLTLPVQQALDVYFAQCSVLVTADDLAVMAATLAAGGVNPVTGRRAVPPEVVGPVLSVMSTCGMYDASGTWLVRVGLPAKSGVSGGVLAVLPGQFGLGTWSPPLDRQGNSVRGVRACEQLSADLGLHLFTPTGPAASPIRRWTTGLVTRSVAPRSPDDRALLDEHGRRIQVVELQGPLHDLAAETVAHRLLEALGSDDAPAWFVALDVRHLGAVHPQARAVLEDALATLVAAGSQVTVVDPRPGGRATGLLGARLDGVKHVHDRDDALAAFEAALLAEHGGHVGLADAMLPLEQHELLASLQPHEQEAVRSLLRTVVMPAGSIVMDAGSPPDGLAWVSAGEVSVMVRAPGGAWRRVSGIGAGEVVGEVSMIDGLPRSARVVTESPSLLHVLDADAVDKLRDGARDAYEALVLAVARLLSSRVRRANTLIQALQD
jgi:glutaminase